MKISKKHLLLFSIFLVNIVFFMQDAREPMDIGQDYQRVSDWIGVFQGNGDVSIVDLLTSVGAWLNASWAGLISLGLTGKISLMCFSLFWLGLFLYNIRKFELLPISFLLMMPIWSIGARMAWLPFIELTLLLVLWNVRKKTPLLFLLSLLLVWLRPTSLIWLLFFVLLWSLLNDTRKIKALVAGGLLGLLLVVRQIPSYITEKLQLLNIEPSLTEDLMAQCFRAPLLLCIIGCMFLFRFSKRSFEESFLFMSMLIGLILALGFGVGADNFLVIHFTLGYLGGRGWQVFCTENKLKKTGRELLSELSILIVIAPLIPSKFMKWAQLPLHETIYENAAWGMIRIQKEAVTTAQVRPFFTQICEESWLKNESCTIVSSQGLFHPMKEEEGSFALSLANIPLLEISRTDHWWTEQHLASVSPLQGIVLFTCSESSEKKSDIHDKEKMLRTVPKRITSERIGELSSSSCTIEFQRLREKETQKKLRQIKEIVLRQRDDGKP